LAASSDAIREPFLGDRDTADRIISLSGIAILLVAIADLHFRWPERSARHAEAANSLARYKLLLSRELSNPAPLTGSRYAELKQVYENVSDLTAKVPERKFLHLKGAHRKKVEMSKYLDEHPGSNIYLLRAKIWLRDNLLSWPRATKP
jgi:hypothetical protein